MKKRLLSALLALVMVLALLPVSVFAEPADEPPAENEETVTTVEENEEKKEDEKNVPAPLSDEDAGNTGISTQALTGTPREGWKAAYVTKTLEAENGKIEVADLYKWYAYGKVNKTDTLNTYYEISSGIIYGGFYYSSTSVPEFKPTTDNNVTVIGTVVSVDVKTLTSANIFIYNGGSCSVTGSKLTTLTVKRDTYSTTTGGTLTSFPSTVTSLTLENVSCSGGFSYTGDAACKIKLTNATLGGPISLDGYHHDTNSKMDRAQNVDAKNSTITGGITIKGSNSIIKLTDTTLNSGSGDIEVNSNGGSITIEGGSRVNDVKVGTIDAKKGYPSVTVNGTAHVGDIKDATSSPSANDSTVTVNMNGSDAQVNSVVFNSANVTIQAGYVGFVTLLKGGKLWLNGKSITVGGVSLNGVSQLEVKGDYDANRADGVNNGAHNTIGSFFLGGGRNITLKIPADPTNTFGATSNDGTWLGGYDKKDILGGTWKFNVPRDALSTTLVYYLLNNTKTEYTYYNAAQLGSALNQQEAAAEGKTTDSIYLRVVGQDYSGTYEVGEVRFMNGITLWGTMQVVEPLQITLPDSINNVKLSSWTDGKQTYKLPNFYTVSKVSDMKLTDSSTQMKYVELNASGGVNTGDVTKLTDVSTKSVDHVAGSVRASLSGTVINLNGAVNSGRSEITVTLTTDAVEMKQDNGKTIDVPVKLDVDLIYFSGTGSLTFANLNETALNKGLTLQTVEGSGLGVLRLSNGTTYTLNGSGLKVRSNIKVANYDPGVDLNGYSYIEVSTNAPTIKTDADKQTVIDIFTASNPKGFNWTDSPAMKQAINAALASITQQQVDSWVAQVQREAWVKVNTGTYNAANNAPDSGYDEVWLVPYLQVNVTNWSSNGTLTFTATPSWRVEVRQNATAIAKDDAYCKAFYDAKKPVNNLTNPMYAKVVKAGTSLGALTGNMGSDDTLTKGVTLTINHNFGAGVYMHQDNTYAYTDNFSTYTITHAGSSLGTMIINKNAPLVTLYENDKTTKVATYDTLQAAVDDVKDSQHINVDQAYKGSMSVNVTGIARKFTIQANGLNVVASNASNGLVDLNGTGGLYTVQLNRDTTAVVDSTTATIAVATVNNGSAVVSATTAKSGTSVTVTCTPAAGYRTGSVGVSAHMTKNNTNAAVSVTRVSENVYSFKVPEGADTITVTPNFVVGTASAIPFTDVATNHWAYNSVKYVYDNGLMNGVNTAGTQFGGTQTLNRAMVVTILYRAAGSPYVGTTSRFSDVANNTWYSQAVAWANQNNIVTGYTNGTFQPNWAITRQELATILYRYNTTYKGRATTGSTTLANFVDQGSVSDWATAGMQWAVGNGIVNGITNGVSTTLSPSGSATRYEAATMLMRYGQGMGL